ncbi:MAG: plasmid mobilization relaxosome protein MobC [Thermosynechococcaceae cyanobacterium]
MRHTLQESPDAVPASSIVIPFRVTPKELEQLDEDAQRSGRTRSDYIRKMLLNAPKPRQYRRPAGNEKLLASLIGHIGKLGSNINQIARNTNAGQSADTAYLQEGIVALREMKSDLKRALGRQK